MKLTPLSPTVRRGSSTAFRSDFSNGFKTGTQMVTEPIGMLTPACTDWLTTVLHTVDAGSTRVGFLTALHLAILSFS